MSRHRRCRTGSSGFSASSSSLCSSPIMAWCPRPVQQTCVDPLCLGWISTAPCLLSDPWSWVHSASWAPLQPSWPTPACCLSRPPWLSHRRSPLPLWTTPYCPQLRTVCHPCEGAEQTQYSVTFCCVAAETEQTEIQDSLQQIICWRGENKERLRRHPLSETMYNKSFTLKLIRCCKENVSKGGHIKKTTTRNFGIYVLSSISTKMSSEYVFFYFMLTPELLLRWQKGTCDWYIFLHLPFKCKKTTFILKIFNITGYHCE